MGCGVRPEAVPGSASTRPNRDGAAGGIREGEQRLELQGREERLLSATLASEDMALALAATGRSIPVWPRARGARHRLRPHPAAHGTPRSGGAVRALVRHASTPPEPVIALETTLLQRLIELVGDDARNAVESRHLLRQRLRASRAAKQAATAAVAGGIRLECAVRHPHGRRQLDLAQIELWPRLHESNCCAAQRLAGALATQNLQRDRADAQQEEPTARMPARRRAFESTYMRATMPTAAAPERACAARKVLARAAQGFGSSPNRAAARAPLRYQLLAGRPPGCHPLWVGR